MNNPLIIATQKFTPIRIKIIQFREKLAPIAKKITPSWRAFYRPMLVASVTIHVLLLISPTPPQSKTEVKPEPSPSPIKREKVKIVSLKGAAKKSSPKSPAAAKPKLKQPPKPKAVVSKPRPDAPPPLPTPKPKEEKPKEEKPQEEKPQEEKPKTEETPTENKEKEETPLEDNKNSESTENKDPDKPSTQNSTAPGGEGEGLLKLLRESVKRSLLESGTNTESVVNETLDSLFIDELSDPAAFLDGSSLKAGSVGSLGISQKTPRIAYDEYIEPILTKEMDFEIEEISEGYAGEKLYKARNAGGVEFYMSLVGIGAPRPTQTFVVIWEKDPRGQ